MGPAARHIPRLDLWLDMPLGEEKHPGFAKAFGEDNREFLRGLTRPRSLRRDGVHILVFGTALEE